MKKISLTIGITLVVLIAAAFNFYPQQSTRPQGENFRGRMFEKLNLTADQKDKIGQLMIDHQKAMIDLRADLQKDRLDLKELVHNGNFSRSDFLKITNAMNETRDKIATARANHMMDVYELLTDQQKKVFSEMPMLMGSRNKGGRMMDGKGPMGRHSGMGQF